MDPVANMRRRTPEPPAGLPKIQHTPGMANELMRELAPLLAEDGIDIDDVDVDDMETLQAAFNRAIERRNMALFTPVGEARDYALTTLRLVVEAIADDDTDLAGAILESVPPKTHAGKATVAGCIGVALDLLDNWLGGQHADAPARLAMKTQLPTGHWIGERAATDVLSLAAKGRAFRSLHTLNVRQGGKHLLYGSALAVTAALQTWSRLHRRISRYPGQQAAALSGATLPAYRSALRRPWNSPPSTTTLVWKRSASRRTRDSGTSTGDRSRSRQDPGLGPGTGPSGDSTGAGPFR